MSQMAAFGGNVHETSPLCPAAGVYGFCLNIKLLSVQFGENLPMNPKVVGQKDKWTYMSTSPRSVTAKFTLLQETWLKISLEFIPTNTFRIRTLAEVLLRLSRLEPAVLPHAPAHLSSVGVI